MRRDMVGYSWWNCHRIVYLWCSADYCKR